MLCGSHSRSEDGDEEEDCVVANNRIPILFFPSHYSLLTELPISDNICVQWLFFDQIWFPMRIWAEDTEASDFFFSTVNNNVVVDVHTREAVKTVAPFACVYWSDGKIKDIPGASHMTPAQIEAPTCFINTLRTGLLNCLNARSRGLTFRHRASCI